MSTKHSSYTYSQSSIDDRTSFQHPMQMFPSSGYREIEDPQIYDLHQRDSTLKRNIRIFKLVSRFLTFLLSIYTTYSQAAVLHTFLTTRGTYINGRNAWAHNTVIWPTILLLSTSGVTLLISIIVLASYFLSTKHANKTNNTVGTAATAAEISAHVTVWITAAIAYRAGNTGNDLWGWTCSDESDSIQSEFQAVINFNTYCNLQTDAWFVSIAQAGLAIVTLTVYVLTWLRIKHKRRLQKHASLVASGSF